MRNIEKIQGDAILRLFKKLQQEKIPLQVKLTNDGYEYLSQLKKIRNRLKSHYFSIEYNQDFLTATQNLDGGSLKIELTDSDGIKYAFQTSQSDVSRDMMWMKFPESIHRYQRRSLFRLEAPPGTRFYFSINEVRYKLLVINVSLGGTLGVLVSVTRQMEQELKLNAPRILEDVELVFPSKDGNENDSRVRIKQCQVIRQKRNQETDSYEYGMEFKEITEYEQEKFTELFYRWQRTYLRQRKLLKS